MCCVLCVLEMHVNHFARIFKFVEEKSKLTPVHKYVQICKTAVKYKNANFCIMLETYLYN